MYSLSINVELNMDLSSIVYDFYVWHIACALIFKTSISHIPCASIFLVSPYVHQCFLLRVTHLIFQNKIKFKEKIAHSAFQEDP
jgi:hypothetical protein